MDTGGFDGVMSGVLLPGSGLISSMFTAISCPLLLYAAINTVCASLGKPKTIRIVCLAMRMTTSNSDLFKLWTYALLTCYSIVDCMVER